LKKPIDFGEAKGRKWSWEKPMKRETRIITSLLLMFGAIAILFGEPKRLPTQGPGQLQPGDIVVAEPEQGRVMVIPYLGQTWILAEQLQTPWGVAVERGGRSVVVAEATAGRITRITPGGGSVTKETVQSELNRPEGVAIDGCSGDILVTTFGDGRLLHISPDGNSLKVLAEGLNGPKGVAVATDRAIIVAEWNTGSLVRVSADGSHKTRIAEGLLNPEMVVVGPNGLIYVAESAAGQISEVNPQTGERRVIVRGLDRPIGISVETWAFRLFATHDNEVLRIYPQAGSSGPWARDIQGAGCAVVPGNPDRVRACFITARCERVDKTLKVTGQVTCGGAPVCTRVELRVFFRNRTIIGPFVTNTDTYGNFIFTDPPFTDLTNANVLGGGVAAVKAADCGACEGNAGTSNRCNF
jgi:sugar lactone lactonase YvrE